MSGADRLPGGPAGTLVIVVSRDTRDATVACVASVLAEARRTGEDVRTVVVDNASADGTAGALRERFGDAVTVLANPRNAGYGAACNQGAAVDPDARSILFLNADTELTPGCLPPLLAALDADPRAGVVAPALVDREGARRETVHGHPTPLALLHRHTALRFLRVGRRAHERYRRPSVRPVDPNRPDGPVDAPVLNGAALLLRGREFRALGGFDPRYFLYFEEADLCRRIGAGGQACRLVPASVVVHAGGASSGPLRDRALVWYLASLLAYVDRWHGRRFGLLYRAVFKPLFLVRMLTDAVRDAGALLLRPRRRREKRAELRLAARFLTRGLWSFLGA